MTNLHKDTIEKILRAWTRTTREGPPDDVLKNHSDDAQIYDVLPPMKYESLAAYRASWPEWQPDAQGELLFELEDVSVTASSEVAFAHGILQCGGMLSNGSSFRDTVRATFCLRNIEGSWKIIHQHISKPYDKD
jgi:ketosteroid isomerase-like protein